MTQSTFDRITRDNEYWFGVIEVRRQGPLVWHLTPNANWPVERSFGFHFSRDCLSYDTPCTFRPNAGTASYRLTYPHAIDDPEHHEKVLEAALWARLVTL